MTDQEIKPNPDPTLATNEAVERSERSTRDYIDGQLQVRDERLTGIDRATALRLSGIEGIPAQINAAIDHLEALVTERFDSVQTQFKERDTRQERESRDNKVAVDAAFAAQKEAAAKQDEANAKAIDKSERATAETIKTNQDLNTQALSAVVKTLDEVKLAVSRIESAKAGGQSIVAYVISAAIIGVAIYSATH